MGGFSTLGSGISWEQIKQKLETEGAKNKAYDIDNDGLVENIRFKEVVELPDTPRDYEVILYKDAVRFYDPNKGKWGSLLYLFGYDEFDNHGGGVWTKYINIPITSTPSEYAQYKIIIDATNVTLYSADGTQKAQGAVASDFWANVKSEGSDIRVFDQAKSQLYFWIEEFDYSNKKAVIWVNLTAGSSELNIAYGNPSATKSSYENPEQVFEFFDDFTNDPEITQSNYAVGASNNYIQYDSVNKQLKYKAKREKSNSGFGDFPYWFKIPDFTATDFILCLDWKVTSASYGEYATHWVFALASEQPNDAQNDGGCDKLGIEGMVDTRFANPPAIRGYAENSENTFTTAWIESLSLNTLYTVKVIKNGNTITVKIYEWDSLIGSQSTEIGDISNTWRYMLYMSGREGDPSPPYEEGLFDNLKVIKLADPADFGTPQILEF